MYKGPAYLPFLSAGEDPGPCSRPILFSKKKKERKKEERNNRAKLYPGNNIQQKIIIQYTITIPWCKVNKAKRVQKATNKEEYFFQIRRK
jgi:hypothetical protein